MTRSKKFLQYQRFPRIEQDALEFLEQKGNSKTANKLAKAISQAQADSLECRQNQPKLTAFYKPINT